MAEYCPSVSGCRAVVEFKDVADMQTIEVTDDQLRLAFNSSQAAIWLVCRLTYLLNYSRPQHLQLSGFFSCRQPRVWNSLPDFIQDEVISTDCFRRVCKCICSFDTSASSILGVLLL